LKVDEDSSPDDLVERLAASGYVREDPIGGIGQFSVRGGILDVWPPDSEFPLRIEFFGDTVDSIRVFDPDTQLSTERLKETSIAPMREFAATEKDFREWAFFAEERFSAESVARSLRDRTEFAEEGESFTGWEFLMPLAKPLYATVFDYLKDAIFVIDEPTIVENSLASLYDNLKRRYSSLTETAEIGLEPNELFLSPQEIRERLSDARRIEIRALGKTAAATDEDFALADGPQVDSPLPIRSVDPIFLFSAAEKSVDIPIQSRSTRNFHGNFADFASHITSHADSMIVTETLGIAERLEEIVREFKADIPASSIQVGQLSAGFEIPSAGLVVYTESDVFGETVSPARTAAQGVATTRAKKPRLGAFISDFRDLKPGDYVVHVDHGIGKFEGLQTISSQGA
jgi:transcription-repair coupling factor (superfamily II helicase)